MESITISINSKKNIKPIGSYALYKKHNTIVKITGYSSVDDSYTIDFNGRIVDTLEQFLDFTKTSIEKKCNNCDVLKNRNIQDIKKLEVIVSYYKNISDGKEQEYKKLVIKYNNMKDKYSSKISALETEFETLINEVSTSHITEIQDLRKCLKIDEKIPEVSETVIRNNFNLPKSSRFLWRDLNNYEHNPTYDLVKDFAQVKDWLCKQYISIRDDNTRINLENIIKNWILKDDEYIVGVYYTSGRHQFAETVNITVNPTTFGHTGLSGGIKNQLIFYTNYGNITCIIYYYDNGFIRAREIIEYKNNKKLNSVMINILNESISSSNATVEGIIKKTHEELNAMLNNIYPITYK